MWLFDHVHIAGAAPDLWQGDDHAATAALLFACLTIGSLLAILAAPARGLPALNRGPSSMRLPLLLSIGAFLATDLAERAIAGQHGFPPLLVLVIGASVYTLIGVASSLLWRCFLGLTLRALALSTEPSGPRAARRQDVGTRLAGFPSRHWMPASAGRSPPTAVL